VLLKYLELQAAMFGERVTMGTTKLLTMTHPIAIAPLGVTMARGE
jgi:hypothetical protein